MRRRVRRLPRKSFYYYIRPFIFLVIIVFALYKGFAYLIPDDFTLPTEDKSAEVSLYVEKGNAQILLWGEEMWDNAPDGVKLFQGDTVKTDGQSRVKLISFDQSIFRLDQKSRVALDYLNNSNENRVIRLTFYEGSLWSEIEKYQKDGANVEINTPNYTLVSKGGTFSIDEDAIRSLGGTGIVQIKDPEDKDKDLREITIGIGQEIVLNQDLLEELRVNPDTEVLTAISDTFKDSDWYKWNQLKHGNIVAYEQDEEENDDEEDEADGDEEDEEEKEDEEDDDERDKKDRLVIDSPAQKSTTDESSITIKGTIKDEQIIEVTIGGKEAEIKNTKFQVLSVDLDEGENSFPVIIKDLEGNETQLYTLLITRDTGNPDPATITEPQLSNGEADITESVQQIVGTVDTDDAYKVIVSHHDGSAYVPYTLDKYVPGTKQFRYYAKEEYGNLKAGKNMYQVVVVDRAGNESEPVEIVLNYTPSEEEEEEEEVEESTDDENETAESTSSSSESEDEDAITVNSGQSLEITEPNQGKNVVLSELPIFLRGKTSTQTTKITVNGKEVSTYTSGNELWAYKLDLALGNVQEGQNEITVEAFDSNGSSLGSASITIIVKLDVILTPTITQPTTKASFDTDKTSIILAGTCSSQTTKVYVNGEHIVYSAGQTSWSTTVTLEEGENVFRVMAEGKGGEKSDEAEIIINF